MTKTLGYTGFQWRSILDSEDDPRFQKNILYSTLRLCAGGMWLTQGSEQGYGCVLQNELREVQWEAYNREAQRDTEWKIFPDAEVNELEKLAFRVDPSPHTEEFIHFYFLNEHPIGRISFCVSEGHFKQI